MVFLALSGLKVVVLENKEAKMTCYPVFGATGLCSFSAVWVAVVCGRW